MKIVASVSLPGTCREAFEDHAPDMHKKKDGFDVTLHFETVEEARRVFEALSEGGEVSIPFGANDCAPGFSGFTDRFGVPWMTNTIPAVQS